MLNLTFFILLLLFPFSLAQTSEEILLAGSCEPFDGQPELCRGVMVGSWSDVWVVNGYGLTQEYWTAQMNVISEGSGLSPLDTVHTLPATCAIQYAKMICPTFFRPCSSQILPGMTDPIGIPHSVCRSVCLVCFFFFFFFFLLIFFYFFFFFN